MNTRAPSSRPLGRSGYSLTELLVVVLLIGIAASIMAPSFNRAMRSYRLDAAEARVSADVALARMTAVRRGRPASLVVVSPTQYRVVVERTPVQILKTVFVNQEYPGFTLTANRDTIKFDSRGLVSGGQEAVITINGPASGPRIGASGKVTVSPVGRVYRGN